MVFGERRQQMKNALNWFELFVDDMDRATRFYETLLGTPMKREIFQGTPMALFAHEEAGVGGALVKSQTGKPGQGGGVVYLDATGKLDACIARAEKAGGAVVLPRTAIGEPGFIARVRDSEGNVVGLHSPR
jgi:predicted enzyme related to lactoylglutathione lyase